MDRTSAVSKRLKEYREIHGLTLSELSAKCGVPAQTLNRYELEQRIPKIDTAVSIAEALGINPLWLQGYSTPLGSTKTAICCVAIDSGFFLLPQRIDGFIYCVKDCKLQNQNYTRGTKITYEITDEKGPHCGAPLITCSPAVPSPAG